MAKKNQQEKEEESIKDMAKKAADSVNESVEEKLPEEAINSIFERIAFLRMTNNQKAELSQRISDESGGDPLFWIQISLSSLIATFGLLQNSVAVIIGAMLIAPLLRPIQGVSFGLTTGQSSNFWKAGKLLIKSVILSVLVAYIFTLIVPLRSETTEILSRTSPNLLDFFIAIASGILALLALSYEKLSNSLAGVAMAAALMPPLSVIGIELALENFAQAGGSFFLFLTNLFAILVVGLFIFLFYGFYPHQATSQWKTFKNAFILLIIIALMSVPLFSSLVQIAERISIQQQAEVVLKDSLERYLTNPKLDRLELVSFSETQATFSTTIKIAETEQVFAETRENIRQELGKALAKEITLELEIVPIASIVSKKELETEEEPALDEKIRQTIRNNMSLESLKSTILTIDVIPVPKESTEDLEDDEGGLTEEQWAVKTVFTLPAGEGFADETKNSIEQHILEEFPGEDFTFVWSPLAERSGKPAPAEVSPEERYLNELSLKWESFFKDAIPEGSSVENLDLSWLVNEKRGFTPTDLFEDDELIFDHEAIASYSVDFDLFIPEEETDNINSFELRMRRFIRKTFHAPVTLDYRVFPFQGKQYTTRPNGNGNGNSSETN